MPWFAPAAVGQAEARALLRRYEDGKLNVTVPGLLYLELLNVAARQLRWPGERLNELSGRLEAIGFRTAEPGLPGLPAIAKWAGRGLTAYDAAYVALAEELEVPLITVDADILRTAGEIARPLA
jgi:predicted nucleic acid-binding protein